MKRPTPYVPLSVTFASGRTGTAIQNTYGLEGLGVWCALLAAGKRGKGQVVLAHDSDWATLGIVRPPAFTIAELLKVTGRLKQTRTTRHGHVLYVTLTRYEQWNNDAQRAFDRERKASTDAQSDRKPSGTLPEAERNKNAVEVEVEVEEEEELQSSSTSPQDNGLPFNNLDPALELHILAILRDITGKDEGSEKVIRNYASRLPLGAVAKVAESIRGRDRPARYAVGALKDELRERGQL